MAPGEDGIWLEERGDAAVAYLNSGVVEIHDETKDVKNGHGSIPALVELMKSGGPIAQARAAAAIRTLAARPDNMISRTPGALRQVRVTESVHRRNRIEATPARVVASYEGSSPPPFASRDTTIIERNRSRPAHRHHCPRGRWLRCKLVALVHDSSEDAQAHAAGALRNLALVRRDQVRIAVQKHRYANVTIFETDTLETLVNLLARGNAAGKQAAAGALRNLAVNVENQQRIIANKHVVAWLVEVGGGGGCTAVARAPSHACVWSCARVARRRVRANISRAGVRGPARPPSNLGMKDKEQPHAPAWLPPTLIRAGGS